MIEASAKKYAAEKNIKPVDGTFTLVKKSDYFHGDKDGRSITLPGNPYMAIRIKRLVR